MVIWVIGLSGSGKTTFANELYKSLKNKKKFIKIDGDVIRDLFQNDLTGSIAVKILAITL